MVKPSIFVQYVSHVFKWHPSLRPLIIAYLNTTDRCYMMIYCCYQSFLDYKINLHQGEIGIYAKNSPREFI